MRRFLAFLEKHPTPSFLILLALLFGVIWLSASSRTPEDEAPEAVSEPKTSRAFAAKESGFVTATAQVKKSGVIDIVALTSGTVQSIAVRVGQPVSAGTMLVTLTNDYGANAGRIAAGKAALEAQFTDRVFALEKEINKREQKIKDDDALLSDREEKNAVRALELELERLRLNRETAKYDRAIAEASDAILRPKALVAGTVEYLGVRPGETVAPGDLIATLKGNGSAATLVASLPSALARFVASTGIATVMLGDASLPLTGGYLAQSENTLGLHPLTFPLPPTVAKELTESEFVTLNLPLVNPAQGFFVPIDAILSGAAGESLLILQDGHALERPVELGDTVGSFVLITQGLNENDIVLLERGLLPGEPVAVIQ